MINVFIAVRPDEMSVYWEVVQLDPIHNIPIYILCVCVCVFRGWQKDYRRDKRRGSDVYCWFVHNSAKGFIDGHYSDYIVPRLNSFLLQF